MIILKERCLIASLKKDIFLYGILCMFVKKLNLY